MRSRSPHWAIALASNARFSKRAVLCSCPWTLRTWLVSHLRSVSGVAGTEIASLPPLPSSSRWRHFQAAATIPPNQQVSLFLYATPDRSGNLATSAFADVPVRRFPNCFVRSILLARRSRWTKRGSCGCWVKAVAKVGARQLAATP